MSKDLSRSVERRMKLWQKIYLLLASLLALTGFFASLKISSGLTAASSFAVIGTMGVLTLPLILFLLFYWVFAKK